MLYLIGTGLTPQQLTLEAVSAAKKCDALYIENYTSIFSEGDVKEVEAIVGKALVPAPRTTIEVEAEKILDDAENKNVGILVIGDPLTATTHTDILLRANKRKIDVKVIPGISIYSVAPGICGLQAYKFGRTTTIVLPEPHFRPTSFFDVILENKKRGLHTLCLLDIKKESNTFMTGYQALDLLTDIAKERDINIDNWIAIIISRAGSKHQKILFGKIKDLLSKKADLDVPQTLIIPGKLHEMEENAMRILCTQI